jgi:hypothetical protein
MRRAILLLLLTASSAAALDEMTVYELLDPSSHRFRITYDVSATEPGATFFFNVIRPGSEGSDEKVIDRADGKQLDFELADIQAARAAGQAGSDPPENTRFIKVKLPRPVPKDGEVRLRIFKTYLDPKSYFADGDQIVFERSLGIRRNVVLLPANYELVASSVPVIVSGEADGRIKISMVNDRDDELEVRLVGRRLAEAK